MGKLSYLTKNIALFSISNFVSKILVFLLVPLYTNVLTTYEYGIADVIQVTLLLLVPAVTVNIGEAALRFGIEYIEKRNSIFFIGLKYVLRAAGIVTVLCAVSIIFVPAQFRKYVVFFMFLFATNAFYEFLILYFQGCEYVQILVMGSVFSTIVTILSNIVFLLIIKIGLNGYLLSQIIAFTSAVTLMLILGKRAGLIKRNEKDANIEHEMITYSRPMIVYSTASWVNNAVDRYFVAGLCGAAVNGIYGVAYKIPAILMVFQRIFAQAWQMSATKSYEDDESDEFFSDMFITYNTFMVLGCSGLILFVRIVAYFMFKKDFYDAWRLVPPLLISVIFGALTGFLGSICLANKDSKSMGKATGIGAFVNIVLNLILIPRYQAMGAAIATGVSYFMMAFLSFLFVKKYARLNVNPVNCLISYMLLITQSVIMILQVKNDYILSTLILIILMLIYMKEINRLVAFVYSKICEKRGKKNV